MSLTSRALAGVVLAGVLGILGEWGGSPAELPVWRVVALMLILGLAYEWIDARRLDLRAQLRGNGQLYLGRAARIEVALSTDSAREREIEYLPGLPDLVAAPSQVAATTVSDAAEREFRVRVVPRRLGVAEWKKLPARVKGVLGLAWWPHRIGVEQGLAVVPDLLGRADRVGGRASDAGVTRRSLTGGGLELQQLRDYQPGDPRRAIDWKASARRGNLITRVFDEDQHLEVVVAVDAGRTSAVSIDGISQLGHFANLAARFAELAVRNEDRVGLLVFADRPLVSLAPARGAPAVIRIRRALAGVACQRDESDLVAAMLQVRRVVRHRALVVLLSDLQGRTATSQLAEAVRSLRPTHMPIVAGVMGGEVVALGNAPAVAALDPYRSLAAVEYQRDVAANLARLRRLGAAALVARPDDLVAQVLRHYRLLRQQRRV